MYKKSLQNQENLSLRNAVNTPWYVKNERIYGVLGYTPIIVKMGKESL